MPTTLPPGWNLLVTPDQATGSTQAAGHIAAALIEKPDLILCTATGNSTVATYQHFAHTHKNAPPRSLRILKLDEWGGLPPGDPATCESHLQNSLVRPLGVSPDRFISFRSDAPDPTLECTRIATWLRENGAVDLAVLGLGMNGHLGFNEPAREFSPGCHVATLSDTTLNHPMLAPGTPAPTHGLTLGTGDILASRSILLLVFGHAKAPLLQRLLTGPVSPQFPASILTQHPDVTCICDTAASSLLTLPDSSP